MVTDMQVDILLNNALKMSLNLWQMGIGSCAHETNDALYRDKQKCPYSVGEVPQKGLPTNDRC